VRIIATLLHVRVISSEHDENKDWIISP